ncbi:hypothetical protein ABIF07_003595 [Bradyrhizobium elkanii]|nr:hypothetical protein [Bradyrhizobium elkanii]
MEQIQTYRQIHEPKMRSVSEIFRAGVLRWLNA